VRVDTFLQRLAPRLESGRGVRSAAIYTMSKEFELADNCGRAYRKSLLYLVRHAFEAERGPTSSGSRSRSAPTPPSCGCSAIGGDGALGHEVGGRRA
jgi:hypothetical protein